METLKSTFTGFKNLFANAKLMILGNGCEEDSLSDSDYYSNEEINCKSDCSLCGIHSSRSISMPSSKRSSLPG